MNDQEKVLLNLIKEKGWAKVLMNEDIPNSFLKKYSKEVPWNCFSMSKKLTPKQIIKFNKNISWKIFLNTHKYDWYFLFTIWKVIPKQYKNKFYKKLDNINKIIFKHKLSTRSKHALQNY